MTQLTTLLYLVFTVLGVTALGGCLPDIEHAEAGDSCTSTTECIPGLICSGGTCIAPNANVSGEGEGQVCAPNTKDCASNSEIRICNEQGTGWDFSACLDGELCDAGICTTSSDCLDRDGDGHYFGECDADLLPLDCHDTNAEVYPGAVEVCNGLDDNCDGQLDGIALSCTTACGEGRSVCEQGQWSSCDTGLSDPEVCGDGIDNNCDGEIDEGCDDECAGGCANVDVCFRGECRQTCVLSVSALQCPDGTFCEDVFDEDDDVGVCL